MGFIDSDPDPGPEYSKEERDVNNVDDVYDVYDIREQDQSDLLPCLLEDEQDLLPDFYAIGYDAAKAGHSQIPPYSIFDAGHSSVTLWNNGYSQYIEDQMADNGFRKINGGGTVSGVSRNCAVRK